jgi:two-component system sensor histidine kinase DesK
MTSPATLLRTLRKRLAATGELVTTRLAAGTDDRSQGWFERIVVPAIVGIYAVGMPVWSFSRVLLWTHRPSAEAAATVAMVCSVVLQLWLLVPAARARRPAQAGWLIAAFSAINLAAFPFIGVLWFAAGEQLAVLAVVYLRPRWSVPAVAALTAAPAGLAAAGHDVAQAHYFAQNTPFWALTIGMLIWLARVAARLRARREELAGSAVIAERVRIDNELGVTLGAELERLIAAGERAARAAGNDPAAAGHELRELTAASRRALARTRRMVSHYQAITVRSELTTAMELLTAAGVAIRSEVPAEALGRALDSERLAGFRSSLTTVLGDQAGCACVITINGGEDVRLEIRREDRVRS